jgi:hypothetical protein
MKNLIQSILKFGRKNGKYQYEEKVDVTLLYSRGIEEVKVERQIFVSSTLFFPIRDETWKIFLYKRESRGKLVTFPSPVTHLNDIIRQYIVLSCSSLKNM